MFIQIRACVKRTESTISVSLYESDDLITWHSIGGALPDLDLRGVRDSAGVWAPDLSYDETNNLFWLTYTIAYQIDGVFKDVCNYVVTARDPHGPWSKPVFVNASGFDPGFFHENGRHYVINPQWDPRPIDGHHKFNGLVMQEFSLEDGLIGEAQVVLDNGDAVNCCARVRMCSSMTSGITLPVPKAVRVVAIESVWLARTNFGARMRCGPNRLCALG